MRVDGPPVFGVTGDETPLKPRADFAPKDFSRLIDAQGARLAWARAMRCPCRPRNRATGQPDPTCPRCRAHPGWTFFGPAGYQIPPEVGELDSVQRALVAQYGASVIRGVLYGLTSREDPYNKLQPWRFGQGMVTVRPENVIAFYDRLVDLDSEIAHTETVEVERAGTGASAAVLPLATRYPVIALNRALGEDGSEYKLSRDLELTPAGVLRWRPNRAPRTGTIVSLHYLCHTHWRVVEQPHVLRRAQVKNKIKKPSTPLGEPTALPLQAALMLEYLTKDPPA